MSKKNAKKNADIEAVAEVASVNPEVVENDEEVVATVVTADETASEPEGDEPEASASVEISPVTEGFPTEHTIRVKSDTGVFDVHVSAVTRQDAKYRVYLQLDQFGPNAKIPKFDLDKYLAKKASASEGKGKKGGKKGEKKTRNVVVVDLDAVEPTEEPTSEGTVLTEFVEEV